MGRQLISYVRLLLSLIGAIACVTVVIIIVRTVTFHVHQNPVGECKQSDLDFIPATEEVLGRFRNSLRFKTVSTVKGQYDRAELGRLAEFIFSAYPAIFKSPMIHHDLVANYSHLFTIKGSNSALTPYMLMAHLDVVPAEPSKWTAPPFGADIIDGFIYARGTIDFKQGVMGILEALNFMVKQGRQPERGFYVALGHDEEVSGYDGAKSISQILEQRGVQQLEFILDEGTTILNDVIPGINGPVAVIGSSEKGYLTLELKVEAAPGHSSMPLRESAIGILANAVSRLEKYPHPSMLGYGPEKDTFEHLSPFMNLPLRVVLTNLWFFKPIVSWVMSRKPTTNAIIRTTTAVTMFNAGLKDNVIAPNARAIVNHRIHPVQTAKQIVEYDRYIINDDRVQILELEKKEPHPISPSGDTDLGYQTIKDSIRQVFNNLPVAPGTMIAATDTRHYLHLCQNVYRFSPTVMWPEDMKRFHGDNERISIRNYEQAINFYYHVIMNANRAEVKSPHPHGEL